MFSVAYESDVELVKKIVTEVMTSNGKVYLDPAPFCRLKVLNASSIDFAANCWCDNEDYWDVYYYITENVYNEFKRKNISVPYNQLEIRERKDKVVAPVVGKKLPQRVEKERPNREESAIEGLTKIFSIHNKDKKNKKEKTKKEKKSKKDLKAEAQAQARQEETKKEEKIKAETAKSKNAENKTQTANKKTESKKVASSKEAKSTKPSAKKSSKK